MKKIKKKIFKMSSDLILTDKFNYPCTMLKYDNFGSFLKEQSDASEYEENLIQKLSGLNISSLNMSCFGIKKIDGPLPFQKWEVPETWEEIFTSDTAKYELERIFTRLQELALKRYTIFPLETDIFRSFKLCKFNKLKVVILGQDPYPQIDNNLNIPLANGLSFSGRKGGMKPTSLDTIYAEINRTYPGIPLQHYDLTSWAEQGVLLLNTCLTVTQGDPGSHIKLGIWKYWIEYVIRYISDKCPNVIFCLWGAKAEEYANGQNPPIGKKTFKLICGHPSSRNQSAKKFAENGHFADIFHYINHKNNEIFNMNAKLVNECEPQLPYIDQINWALIN
jgi:uracil-DNA glycosylase